MLKKSLIKKFQIFIYKNTNFKFIFACHCTSIFLLRSIVSYFNQFNYIEVIKIIEIMLQNEITLKYSNRIWNSKIIVEDKIFHDRSLIGHNLMFIKAREKPIISFLIQSCPDQSRWLDTIQRSIVAKATVLKQFLSGQYICVKSRNWCERSWTSGIRRWHRLEMAKLEQ